MPDYLLPWYTSIWAVLTTFLISWLVLHVTLVRVSPLTSIGWKRIDYIWVTLALLGVLATVEQTRVLVASNLADRATSRAESSIEWVKDAGRFGTSDAICRTFVRGEFSPPEPEFQRIQVNYTNQCNYFRSVLPQLEELNAADVLTIDLSSFVPPIGEGPDHYASARFRESIEAFNTVQNELRALIAEQSATAFHDALVALGPFILAFAVALRLTKVSGEIDIERTSAGTKVRPSS